MRKQSFIAILLVLFVGLVMPVSFSFADELESEELSSEIESDETEAASDEDELVLLEEQVELIQEGAFPSIEQTTEAPSRRKLLSTKTSTTQTLEQLLRTNIEAYNTGKIDISAYGISQENLKTLYEKIVNSSPEYFYLSGGYILWGNKDDGSLVRMQLLYEMDVDLIPAAVEEFEAAIDDVVSWVPDGADEATTVKAVHDWFVRNVEYDTAVYEAFGGRELSNSEYLAAVTLYGHDFNAYGSLVEKSAVCQGYSLGIAAVFNRLGITNDLVQSDSLNHMWNAVMVDGLWYHMDATWDDPSLGYEDEPDTTYFLKSSSAIYHEPSSSWTFVSGTVRSTTSTLYDNADDWYVYGPLVNVSVSPSSATLVFNEQRSLSFASVPPNHFSLASGATWTSGEPALATVSSQGVVTAKHVAGTLKIKCTLDGLTGSCSLTITPVWTRLGGSGALDTMRLIVGEYFTSSNTDTVVIATNAGFKDALAAAAVAGSKGAPILLTNPKTLSSQTRAEIVRLNATKAIIVGGTGAVAPSVENSLKSMGLSVSRIGGGNAILTSCELAKNIKRSSDVIIATQKSFADALSIAPYSYATKTPIILTTTAGSLTTAARETIASLGATHAIIVGGEGVIPKSTVQALRSDGLSVERVWGKDSLLTCQEVAAWEFEQGFSLSYVGVATRNNYKDALCGAALMGSLQGPIILVNGSNISAAQAVISSNASQIEQGYYFGGTSVVTTDAATRIRTIQ